MIRPFRVFSLLIFITCATFAQNYVWPTDASKNMTSSFCEFRPRHYHAAIDIKTWNQTGYKIFAIDDGYVYRLRVSANGYGKAIYLKLRDGNFVIYGHLNGFTKALEKYADSLRIANKNNWLDKRGISPKRFPVKRGQHIGYTGKTGIGVPHLHFEMRDSYNRPINPLKFYKAEINDHIAPKARYLAVIPASAKTFIKYQKSSQKPGIDFQPDTLIIPLPQQSQVQLSEPIHLTGRAYLALRTFDMADGVNNRFGFYRAEMRINDSLIYHVKYDRFSYDETSLIELDKNFSLWRKGFRYYQNFYRHPGNSLPFYGNLSQNAGMLSGKILREGKNLVQIRVQDFFGNHLDLQIPIIYHAIPGWRVQTARSDSDTVRFTIKSSEKLARFRLRAVRYQNGTANSQAVRRFAVNLGADTLSAYFYNFTVPRTGMSYSLQATNGDDSFSLPVEIVPDSLPETRTSAARFFKPGKLTNRAIKFYGNQVAIKGRGYPVMPLKNDDFSVFYQQYQPLNFQIAFPFDRAAQIKTPFGSAFDSLVIAEVTAHSRVVPGRPRTIYSADRALSLRFPSNGLHDTLYVRIRQEKPHDDLPAKYRYLADIYDVQPFDQPLNYGAYVSFILPDSIIQQPGVGIYYFDHRKGWSYLPTRSQPQNHAFSTRVTSLEKFTAIQDTVPPQIIPVRLTASVNRPAKFHVYDEFSGLFRERQIRVEINGRWSLFEFDPEEDFVLVHTRHLPVGESKVAITARDNAGNRKTKIFNVTRL